MKKLLLFLGVVISMNSFALSPKGTWQYDPSLSGNVVQVFKLSDDKGGELLLKCFNKDKTIKAMFTGEDGGYYNGKHLLGIVIKETKETIDTNPAGFDLNSLIKDFKQPVDYSVITDNKKYGVYHSKGLGDLEEYKDVCKGYHFSY